MGNTWQIKTADKTVMYTADEGLRAETSCIQLLINLLCIAHKLFAYFEQRSNEPLLLQMCIRTYIVCIIIIHCHFMARSSELRINQCLVQRIMTRTA